MQSKLTFNNHPIWKNVSPLKKPLHILRIFAAKNLVKVYPRSMFIGITGSVGKTSTAICCQAVLSEKINTISTRGNLDPVFNIPMTILRITPKVKRVIFEMGIEYKGEMELYLQIVRPATAVYTRVFYAHSQFLGGVEDILDQKGKLVEQLPKNGLAILNWDDINTRKLADRTQAEIIFYGTDPKKCHLWAGNIRIENYQTKFELNYGVERVEVSLPLLGKHWVTSALAASALGVKNGLSLVNIKKGLEKIIAAPHRLAVKEGLGDWVVIDDTYNSSPVAVEEAVNLLNDLPARRRIIVLGEMRELGEYSERLHRATAQKIFKEKVDLVILSGGDTRFLADELLKLGFPQEKLDINLSNSQIVTKILQVARKGDLVLVKASRAVKLDEVVERITKKLK